MESAVAQKKLKILLVEDDRYISSLLADKISFENQEVITAYDGTEAVVKARENKPDVILLDIILPEKDGFTVLKELKSDPDLKKIPVIILSNLGQPADIQKGKELGAIEYYIKSDIDVGDLVKNIIKKLV